MATVIQTVTTIAVQPFPVIVMIGTALLLLVMLQLSVYTDAS